MTKEKLELYADIFPSVFLPNGNNPITNISVEESEKLKQLAIKEPNRYLGCIVLRKGKNNGKIVHFVNTQ